jgi:GntR family transcriptional regulator
VTLRQALSALVDQGLVTSSAGRGWFVSTQLNEPPGTLVSFSEMASARGLRPSSRVLEFGVRSATLDEAEGLNIAPGAGLVSIKRLRLIDGIATAVDYSRLPARLVPGLENVSWSTESLYATLRDRYGIFPTRADFCVEAIPAPQVESDLLEVSLGTPLLASTQITFDQYGRRIEIGRITYRGDRYRFRAALVARSSDRIGEGPGLPEPPLAVASFGAGDGETPGRTDSADDHTA